MNAHSILTPRRLVAIGIIYCFTVLAWFILSAVIYQRTNNYDDQLRSKVKNIWGAPLTQQEPMLSATTVKPKTINDGRKSYVQNIEQKVDLKKTSNLAVNLSSEPRKKGLLWYNLYKVDFDGKYTLENPETTKANAVLLYQFPNTQAVYDNFVVKVDGQELHLNPTNRGQEGRFEIEPQSKRTVEIQYKSQGMDDWKYLFSTNVSTNSPNEDYDYQYARSSVSTVDNFKLTATTDFKDVDFGQNALSPTQKSETANGWQLVWDYNHLISGQNIGISVPQKLNPGPFVQRVTTFAPISLLFFFFVMLIIAVLKKISFHPVHFFFIATAFFSFHLLFAYLVDLIDIQLAFFLAAVTSIFLTISYLRLAVGTRFAFVEAGVSQLIYLIAFTYSFFFEGYTGLIIVILSIITLFVTMQLTGRINWHEVLDTMNPKEPAHAFDKRRVD